MKVLRAWPLFAVALLALVGPWLAPRDPLATLDPAALRMLPPFSRVPALVAKDGALLPVAGEDPDQAGRRLFDYHLEGDEVLRRKGPRVVRTPLADLQRNADGSPRVVTLTFLAGTDPFGRDLLSRLLAGARVSLAVGLGGVLIAALLGTLAGLFAGAGGAALDLILGRTGDALLAIPRIVLVAALAALFHPGVLGLSLLLGLTGWAGFARLVRADVVTLTGSEMAAAARAVGCSPARVALRHLAPHTMATVLAAAGLRIGPFVLLEASLSFLGFGIAPPLPSWGNILAEGRDVLFEGWWVVAWPGLLLGGTVVMLNKLADDLRRVVSAESPA